MGVSAQYLEAAVTAAAVARAAAQAELRDSDDRLLDHATSGCVVFPLPAR